MAGHLPKRDNKKKVQISLFPHFLDRSSPYYSTTEDDSGRKQTKKCPLQSNRVESNSPRPTSQTISNKKHKAACSSAEKGEKKKAHGESKMCYSDFPSERTPSGMSTNKHGVANDSKNHNKPNHKIVEEEIKWDSSIENLNENLNEKMREKLEQRFRNVTKKLQSPCPCVRKIKAEICYDESCLSKTTRNVLDNKSSTNEMLWVNPKYLDNRANVVTMLSESVDKPSRVEVPIASYIRGQKQLKLKRNRRHGEQYFFDKDLNYRRIVHDNSFSLNLHNHATGYDDDMGDPHSMQKEMTSEEKKALGLYPNPPYPEVRINQKDLLPIRVIASETTAGEPPVEENGMSTNSDTTKITASISDHFLCQMGFYSEQSELSEQSTPREGLDAYLEGKLGLNTYLEDELGSAESDTYLYDQGSGSDTYLEGNSGSNAYLEGKLLGLDTYLEEGKLGTENCLEGKKLGSDTKLEQVKPESRPDVSNYTNNEGCQSARSNNSTYTVPSAEDTSDPIAYILNKEFESSRTTMEDYMEFRSVMALSKERENEEIIEQISPQNNSTGSENENEASTEETDESTGEGETEAEKENEPPAQNNCNPSVFFPDMIPDPNFNVKYKEKLEIYANNKNNNTTTSSKMEWRPIKVKSDDVLDYKSPNTEEFYIEVEKWSKLVNGGIFRRQIIGPGLEKYSAFAPGQKKFAVKPQSPNSDGRIFETLYKKYILDHSDPNFKKEPSEEATIITHEVAPKMSVNLLSCPADRVSVNDFVEKICVDCIYKSPLNPNRFPLQVIAEDESECEVDFGQPVLTKNWLYNYLLKPSSIEVESITSNDEHEENEYDPSNLNVDESEDQENILGLSNYSPEFMSDDQTTNEKEVETEVENEEEGFWLQPTIDWENMSPIMVYNIMKLTGGFLTEVYSRDSLENINCPQNKTEENFTAVFTPANLQFKRASVCSIEEINSTEEEETATPSSSTITVIERKIQTQEKLPAAENIQIPSTSAEQNIQENAAEENDETHEIEHRHHHIHVSQRGRRKLPIRIAFGFYNKLRGMRTSLSRMMSGMKNYFRVKGVIGRISPLSLSQANIQRNKNRISFIKQAPSTFNTFSVVKLSQQNANPGIKTHSAL